MYANKLSKRRVTEWLELDPAHRIKDLMKDREELGCINSSHNILHSFIIKYRSYLLVTMLRTSSQVFRSRTSQRYDSRVVVDN